LDGEPVGVSVYVAAPFRFGQPRENTSPPPARVVLETWLAASDERAERVSLSAGEALRLARVLARLADGLADDLTFAGRAG
jgi:hypothetical protein